MNTGGILHAPKPANAALFPYLLFVHITALPEIKMSDYSIGDRVEVRWQAELFDAAVVKVHPRKRRYILDGESARIKIV